MRHKRLNRYERREMHADKMLQSLKGTGIYVYRNTSTQGSLHLPKATASGRRVIGPNEEFQGDSYFMNMVRTHELRLIRTISMTDPVAETPAPTVTDPLPANPASSATDVPSVPTVETEEVASPTNSAADDSIKIESVADDRTNKNRQPRKAENMNPKSKKLLLDQPSRVTNEGTVEQVEKDTPVKPLNERDHKNKPDVLLTESPSGGVEIIIE